jgi:dihydropteroate synthase
VILELGAGHRFDVTNRALVIGMLDTPTGPGSVTGRELDQVLDRVDRAISDGADALMVSVPRSADGRSVPLDLELERVPQLIRSLQGRAAVPLGVRTGSGVVLRAALECGAVLACDLDGFVDEDRLSICVGFGASVMVSGAAPRGGVSTGGLVDHDVTTRREFLSRQAAAALDAGVAGQRIIVDDGLDLLAAGQLPAALLATTEHLVALGHHASLAVPPIDGSARSTAPSADAHVGATHAAHVRALVAGCRVLRARAVRPARRAADLVAELLERRGAGGDDGPRASEGAAA